ncbi:hypothetical protein Hamer_G031419 [Homarus americanus]|uniref:Uncharacterized protein n=1 Tax=Homarus americanus TaxID=6706 RepID=A0A8J5N030_HOMAM|nr:hypothetical protein Hamer_G031762 [Homarus americanus]KAG7169821.1 hypothetical protein Hamer_G031419 [Homarus americanus]
MGCLHSPVVSVGNPPTHVADDGHISVTMESRCASSPCDDVTEPTPSTGYGARSEIIGRKRLPLKRKILTGYHSSSESEESVDEPKSRQHREVGCRSRTQPITSRRKPTHSASTLLPSTPTPAALPTRDDEAGDERGTVSEVREGKI